MVTITEIMIVKVKGIFKWTEIDEKNTHYKRDTNICFKYI